MDFLTPKYTPGDVLDVAKIDHTTLSNWLRRGLLDRLGATRPEGSWLKYSLLDVITITAEAQLAFLGITPRARQETHMAEHISARCMALINRLPLEHRLIFTSPGNAAKITVDCRQLADEVLSALHTKT